MINITIDMSKFENSETLNMYKDGSLVKTFSGKERTSIIERHTQLAKSAKDLYDELLPLIIDEMKLGYFPPSVIIKPYNSTCYEAKTNTVIIDTNMLDYYEPMGYVDFRVGKLVDVRLFCLVHELQHHVQVTTRRLRIDFDDIIWETGFRMNTQTVNELHSTLPSEYNNLPWENDANTAAIHVISKLPVIPTTVNVRAA